MASIARDICAWEAIEDEVCVAERAAVLAFDDDGSLHCLDVTPNVSTASLPVEQRVVAPTVVRHPTGHIIGWRRVSVSTSRCCRTTTRRWRRFPSLILQFLWRHLVVHYMLAFLVVLHRDVDQMKPVLTRLRW
jgi:hypothetical protein